MSNDLELVTKDKLTNYLKIAGVAGNLSKEEQDNFLNIAMEFNLNPFKREIYCTSYGQGEWKKTSIIIGYEVYIKRAERTGQLDGWHVVTSGSVKDNDLKAIITIYRKDRKYPFVHEVDYSEYVQTTFDKVTKLKRPNQIWSEKPITMLKKVATAQGFRLCFSDELGGIPYDNSELPGTMEREINIANQDVKIESPQEQLPEPTPEQPKELVYKLNDLKDKVMKSTKKGKELLTSVKNMKKHLDTNFSDCADYLECNVYLSNLAATLEKELEAEKEIEQAQQELTE